MLKKAKQIDGGYFERTLSSKFFFLEKGGDPAAGSPTATLLRLHPNRWPYRGQLPPEG